ncbi:hypothetical protein BDN67DRAFT_986307 [Paxillus ammoniavirescens]|nr:hypothetical protein BDN67DRAFT_986307 [Paxillus ammoniavirescens]
MLCRMPGLSIVRGAWGGWCKHCKDSAPNLEVESSSDASLMQGCTQVSLSWTEELQELQVPQGQYWDMPGVVLDICDGGQEVGGQEAHVGGMVGQEVHIEEVERQEAQAGVEVCAEEVEGQKVHVGARGWRTRVVWMGLSTRRLLWRGSRSITRRWVWGWRTHSEIIICSLRGGVISLLERLRLIEIPHCCLEHDP